MNERFERGWGSIVALAIALGMVVGIVACGGQGAETTASPSGGTSNPSLPTVTTSALTGVTATSATGGGNVSSDGGAPVTARGVCWSTSPNPTLSHQHTTNGTGTGSFTSTLTGLTANTTYHVRAYATNAVGTAYGSDVTFTTPSTTTLRTLTLTVSPSGSGTVATNPASGPFPDGTTVSLTPQPAPGYQFKRWSGANAGDVTANRIVMNADKSLTAEFETSSGYLFTLDPGPAPADNPLKGFMPYAGTYTFPHSLEWFYIPMKDLQTGYTSFDWTKLEAKLDAIAGRGHQAVFRIYLDYPNTEYGVPAFLSHVPKNAYTDYNNGKSATSYSPDYSHADLRQALSSLIAALGAKYDGDPRIGFIQVGLLGFWGEWHTYPHNDWMASTTVMNEVLTAFQNAFSKTHLLMREPKSGVDCNRPRLGFHDDSFAYTTIGTTSWYFWPKITSAGLGNVWQDRPIGGEVRPEVQGCMWDDTPCTPTGQDYNTCVDTTHASWMLNHGAFSLTGTARERAIVGAQRLGYTLQVPSCQVMPCPLRVGGPLQVDVFVRNVGVAPFYYPWTVEVGALSSGGSLTTWTTTWDLRSVQPGASPLQWTLSLPAHGLAAGSYTLMLRVVNPLSNGKPFRFGNQSQDQHRTGWLSLGTVIVQ